MIGNFVLGSFLAYNCTLLALKMKYVKIEDKMRSDILKSGLYHITSEESADKILEDGYIRPSGIVTSLGAKKTFFFAGIPNIELIRENVAAVSEQFEWTAIQIKPDENDLSNYRIRAYDDNSVVCKGKCNLDGKKVRKVNLVLDLNQDGFPYIREKTSEEIKNGYIPKEELIKKFTQHNNSLVVPRNLMKAYFRKPYQIISKLVNSIKSHNNQNYENEENIDKSNLKQKKLKNFSDKYRVKNYQYPKINEKVNDEIENQINTEREL